MHTARERWADVAVCRSEALRAAAACQELLDAASDPDRSADDLRLLAGQTVELADTCLTVAARAMYRIRDREPRLVSDAS